MAELRERERGRCLCAMVWVDRPSGRRTRRRQAGRFCVSSLLAAATAASAPIAVLLPAMLPLASHLSERAAELNFGRLAPAVGASIGYLRRPQVRTLLRAVAEPPTRIAPPVVADGNDVSRAEWAECLVQYTHKPSSSDAQEVWVFRKTDFEEFQRLIGLRLRYCPAELEGPSRFGAARRAQAEAETNVICRDRTVDPELMCAECVRVFTGGAYNDKAISVPAFPSQPSVLGCLALSGGSEAEQVVNDDPLNPLRQTAFCNTVNARFAMEPN
mmetsp:Transcript_102026/g.288064  ORF Transcript_102026/g.288064 Transcript_102026/m.288064 type:complete len:272 (-) Transcript_102026:101-916(-)